MRGVNKNIEKSDDVRMWVYKESFVNECLLYMVDSPVNQLINCSVN